MRYTRSARCLRVSVFKQIAAAPELAIDCDCSQRIDSLEYCLVHAEGIAQPTFNRLYTCYKDAGRRTPEFFKQSVIDTKNKQGWIDLTDDNHLVITHRGTEFVEHDLPKAKPQKSERKKK